MTEGRIDPRVILGLGAAAEDDLAARPSHHDGEDEHDHEDFNSVVIELPEQADVAALTARVVALARDHAILRVKGYIAVPGKPMRLLVQAVGPRLQSYFDRPWNAGERRSTELVVIAGKSVDRAGIEALLRG